MVAQRGITFIDFGNLYKLDGNRPDSVNEKHELLRIMTGAAFRDKAFVLKGFERLLSESGRAALNANRAKAEAILDAVLKKGKFSYDIVYRLNAAVAELQKLGLELPPQINCFVQSMARLANSVTEMNTIMKQYKGILDAVNGYTLVGPASKRDELDVVGKAFDLFATEEGKKTVVNEQRLINSFPGQITAFQKYILDNVPGDNYRPIMGSRLLQVADPKAEAQRIVEILRKHLDAEHSARDRVVQENIERALEDYRREIDEAGADIAKKVLASTKFTTAYINKGLKAVFGNIRNAQRDVAIARIRPPKTFASAFMDLLLDNYDAVVAAFDYVEGLKIGADAKNISVKELGQDFWVGKEEVLQAMKADAKDTAADTDTSSYRIDIGV